MTTTAQALSGSEQDDYVKIQKNIKARATQKEQDDFQKLQGDMVNAVISNNSSVRVDIANQVRIKVLYSGNYDKYKKP